MVERPRRGEGSRLVLFRHGPAEELDPVRWPDDAQRPLSRSGREEVRRAAHGLARLTGPVGRIASSPAERARATAELLAEALTPPPRPEAWPELAPGSAAEPILARVRPAPLPTVVVGHAPTLSELVGYAVIGDAVPVVHIARGGAACVDFPREIRPGAGVLAWLLTRRQLSGMRD